MDFLFNRDVITFPQSLRGTYTFSSLANFEAGLYNTQGYTQSFGVPAVSQSNPNVGCYLHDEWKVLRSVTVNAGVRYDLQFLKTIHTDHDNVSPRVGVAWSPYGTSRTVIRGSYGLFYDRVPLRALANALLSAGNTTDAIQARLLSYTFSPGQAGAPAFPDVASAPPTGALLNFATMDRDLQNAYAQQASLEVEQQLSSRTSLGVSYQHVRGEHLLVSINRNIRTDGTRPNPAYGNERRYESRADSFFDGLAVSVVQRPNSWASARLSYTWSKAIDDVGEFFFSSPVNNFFVGEDRGRSDDDQRHRVVFDGTVFSSTQPASRGVDHVTHGWRLGTILQFRSRLPLNVITGTTTKQGTAQRPCTPGYSLAEDGGLNACTQALPGALISRNSGVGFGFFSVDARVSRSFALTAHLRLEGIAEAFNVLNHRNDMIPNGNFGTSTTANKAFGQATAVGDPRSVQIAARLTF